MTFFEIFGDALLSLETVIPDFENFYPKTFTRCKYFRLVQRDGRIMPFLGWGNYFNAIQHQVHADIF